MTAKPVKSESVTASIRSRLGVGEVVWARGSGRRHMVMEATSLVKANDEKSLIPLWSAAKGIVYLLDENLPVGNQSGRVNRVRSNRTTGWIYVAELRQPPQIGVLIELIDRLAKLNGTAVSSPGEIMGIARAAGIIVGPAVVGCCRSNRLWSR